jgi:hypothetical protein
LKRFVAAVAAAVLLPLLTFIALQLALSAETDDTMSNVAPSTTHGA